LLKLHTRRELGGSGPFTILKRNSPLSYAVDTGDIKLSSVHVQLLKQYLKNDDEEVFSVRRATSVFEPDDEGDSITDKFAEVNVKGADLSEDQKRDIRELEERHKQTLTKEPGLTRLAEFTIETGDAKPVYQRPYNTPAHFKESIDKEIDWLLEKQFIRPSTGA